MKNRQNIGILLKDITELSHRFGTSDYVFGGGGNTSVKDNDTLWVKPSGITLSELKPQSFVALDRNKVSALYAISPPADTSQREKLVSKIMADAAPANSTSRASVEAPLHNLIEARFVVHTHPAVVNGMTCARDGAKICNLLFPQALWLDYIDPGYTLCIRAQQEITKFREKHGRQPAIIFLKNHGVFVSAETKDEIIKLYDSIFHKLNEQYRNAGIKKELVVGKLPDSEILASAERDIRLAVGKCFIKAAGCFNFAERPLSPDHIVYSKSFPFVGRPSAEAIGDFKSKYGYLPKVIVCYNAVFGIGETQKKAQLALRSAMDGALVKKLADAFGKIEYMTEKARLFIENWEAESYRSRQI